MKHMKRFITFLLAVSLMATTSISAFAQEPSSDNREFITVQESEDYKEYRIMYPDETYDQIIITPESTTVTLKNSSVYHITVDETGNVLGNGVILLAHETTYEPSEIETCTMWKYVSTEKYTLANVYQSEAVCFAAMSQVPYLGKVMTAASLYAQVKALGAKNVYVKMSTYRDESSWTHFKNIYWFFTNSNYSSGLITTKEYEWWSA